MIPRYRFSGHESFPCRYAWIPKACHAISADPKVFWDDDHAMATLGVGKNMVRSIRFWIQAFGVAVPIRDNTFQITAFGQGVFGDHGHDPFLEDVRTLWLLHWKLCMNVEEPLFAWDYLINRWPNTEMTRTEALNAFAQEAVRINRKLSSATLEKHFDVFLHTYVPTAGTKAEVQEDGLDCPLVELSLIEKVGERRFGEQGRREPIYSFRRTPKPAITPGLFDYCLDDFWTTYRAGERTLSFRDVALHPNSPGQVFKLTEPGVRERLEDLRPESGRPFEFRDSAALPQLIRLEGVVPDLLASIYELGDEHVRDR